MRTTTMLLAALLLLPACGEEETAPQPEAVVAPPTPTMASCLRNGGATCIEYGPDSMARMGWAGVQQSCGNASYEQLVPDVPCPSENRVGGCGEPGSNPSWSYAPHHTVESAMAGCRSMQGLGCPRCTFVLPP